MGTTGEIEYHRAVDDVGPGITANGSLIPVIEPRLPFYMAMANRYFAVLPHS